MEIIMTKRRGGKTTRAIRLADKTGSVLVVDKPHLARLMKPCTNIPPISYSELLNGIKGADYRRVVIDDVEEFIKFIVNVNNPALTVQAVTITESES